MYQIIRITDRAGAAKDSPEDRANQGCIGEAKMEDGCVLMHCRYDRRGMCILSASLWTAWTAAAQDETDARELCEVAEPPQT